MAQGPRDLVNSYGGQQGQGQRPQAPSALSPADPQFEDRKNRWRAVIDELSAQPGAASFLTQVGAGMMQPLQPGESFMAQLGQSVSGAQERQAQLQGQQFEQQQAQEQQALQQQQFEEQRRQFEEQMQFKRDQLQNERMAALTGAADQGPSYFKARKEAFDDAQAQMEQDCENALPGETNPQCERWNQPNFMKEWVEQQTNAYLGPQEEGQEEAATGQQAQQVDAVGIPASRLRTAGYDQDASGNPLPEGDEPIMLPRQFAEEQGLLEPQSAQAGTQPPAQEEGTTSVPRQARRRERTTEETEQETSLEDMSLGDLHSLARQFGISVTKGGALGRRATRESQKSREELIRELRQAQQQEGQETQTTTGRTTPRQAR